MFSLSRRQAHAALAGVAAAATYLAAAEIGSKKPVKIGGLFLLSSMAMAGMVGQVLNSKASAKAHVTEARLNNFLGNGGSLGGNLVVNGDHTVTGDNHVSGTSFTHLGAPPGFGNVQVNSGGLGLNGGGNLSMNGQNMTNAGSITGGGSPVGVTDGWSMGASLIMNGHDAFTFGHVTANQIGPGGNRAGIGGGTNYNPDGVARLNFLLAQLQNAGICY